MALIETLLFGFAGGVLLPQDPVPVAPSRIGPEVDGNPIPPLPPLPPKTCNPCRVCGGIVGAVLATVMIPAIASASGGFWPVMALSLATGLLGGTLSRTIGTALCLKRLSKVG